jgi:hypothetical protein
LLRSGVTHITGPSALVRAASPMFEVSLRQAQGSPGSRLVRQAGVPSGIAGMVAAGGGVGLAGCIGAWARAAGAKNSSAAMAKKGACIDDFILVLRVPMRR